MIDKIIGKALEKAEAPYDWYALNRVQVHDTMHELAQLVAQECINTVVREANAYSEPTWAYEIVNDIQETFGITQALLIEKLQK